MKKYRKKPVVIEAVQWPGFVNQELSDELGITRRETASKTVKCHQCNFDLFCHGDIPTLEGNHIVCPKDWIIRGIKGELYPCKPDIFEATYEEVK
jgi:hypothetical protein